MVEDYTDKFNRYIGKEQSFSFGEEDFTFEPLGAEDVADYVFVMVGLASGATDAPVIKKSIALIDKTITQTYPALTERKRSLFISRNYFRLLEVLAELNGDVGMDRTVNMKKRIEEMKAKVQGAEANKT